MSSYKTNWTTPDGKLGHAKGIYKVTEPVIGYKKVACKTVPAGDYLSYYTEKILGFVKRPFLDERCIIKGEIPVGSTIIKPQNGSYDTKTVDYNGNEIFGNYGKLRTDGFIPLEITPIKKHNLDVVYAVSLWDLKHKYKINKISKPNEPLDEDIYMQCVSGIHFFGSKKEAEDFGW